MAARRCPLTLRHSPRCSRAVTINDSARGRRGNLGYPRGRAFSQLADDYARAVIRLFVRFAAAFLAIGLTTLAPPPSALAAPPFVPQTVGAQLDRSNIVLMQPGVAYQAQLAGHASDVSLQQIPAEGGSYRNQLYINGSVASEFSTYGADDPDGQVFLVYVAASDSLIYRHGQIGTGSVFIHSVVYRFDGARLVDAAKVDRDGYGAGWFALDRSYDSSAGAGTTVTRIGGITNTCKYVSNAVSCTATGLPRPKISGTLKVGKTLAITTPQVGSYSSYLWYRCNKKGKSCKGIVLSVKKGEAAIEKTYKLRRADKGRRMMMCADFSFNHWGDWVCSKPSARVK